jgi:formylmethanofuran dehydrogenase subunit E
MKRAIRPDQASTPSSHAAPDIDATGPVGDALASSREQHGRLCPRQVLGVRIGLAGASALSLAVPRHDKRLLVVAETDGCLLSGIEAATGCSTRHRTLRIEDYGKVAATFIDSRTGQAFRIAPRPGIRSLASAFAPDEPRRYYAQLLGYQRISEVDLVCVTAVTLVRDVSALVGRAGVRVDCSSCGEEILNGREQIDGGAPYCLACRAEAYYRAPDAAERAHDRPVRPSTRTASRPG